MWRKARLSLRSRQCKRVTTRRKGEFKTRATPCGASRFDISAQNETPSNDSRVVLANLRNFGSICRSRNRLILLAGRIAGTIASKIEGITDAHCLLVSRIGCPVMDPQLADVCVKNSRV